MPAPKRSNPLALAVLGLLYERPMHPYEMAHTLRSRAKQESVRLNYGSLYGVVDSLEKRGLIAALETTREGRRPPRTVYEISEAGKVEMIDWLADLVAVPVKEFLQYEAALSFLPYLPPDEAVPLLRERCDALEIRLNQMEALHEAAAKQGLPRLFTLESEYQHALLQAELEFTRVLIADIESGELGGLDGWRSLYEPSASPGSVNRPDVVTEPEHDSRDDDTDTTREQQR